jgi:anti-sigma factor RsiW
VTCRDVLAFLSDYVAGDLPRRTREVFASHLASCESCRAYLDSYRTTIELARAAADDAMPQPPQALVEAILASRGGGPGITS